MKDELNFEEIVIEDDDMEMIRKIANSDELDGLLDRANDLIKRMDDRHDLSLSRQWSLFKTTFEMQDKAGMISEDYIRLNPEYKEECHTSLGLIDLILTSFHYPENFDELIKEMHEYRGKLFDVLRRVD